MPVVMSEHIVEGGNANVNWLGFRGFLRGRDPAVNGEFTERIAVADKDAVRDVTPVRFNREIVDGHFFAFAKPPYLCNGHCRTLSASAKALSSQCRNGCNALHAKPA